ncbi:hypothetical protein GUITHDRAFT_115907 [Guillardia theta CCMP2712]|uniref:Uncharacterized protein n=1 Tax=Guillardia theta (strain CCMP2712) TaxID=905079 RepID=L1IQ37_GUITC|nr:hypothetical protein GUITHDRAFT_115907 [Guillardia theta CCMP2712]EKX37935.1 hypothetical protein GUITHDRAFT_115907 [Guillardia theta CCMP2712]|eukprot:XP_005824915.1 hypothetical protein GUITHDRAFT_115907 [Guillardia theta CCMP2712]
MNERSSPPLDVSTSRAMINPDIAREIFMAAKKQMETGSVWKPTSLSVELGIKYGVTAKAIRDIWNKRTWAHATLELWSDEERSRYKKMRTGNHTPTRECLYTQDGQEAAAAHDSEGRVLHDQHATQGSSSSIEDVSITGNCDAFQIVDVSRDSDGFSKDGWMTCPERIALFLQNIPEVQFDAEIRDPRRLF